MNHFIYTLLKILTVVINVSYATAIHANESLHIYTEHLPGFQYLDKNGNLVGKNAQKFKDAFKFNQLEYTLSVLDWSTSYNAAIRESNACIFSIARLPVREKYFDWLVKLSHFDAYFYTLPSKNIVLDNIDDAKMYKTAVLANNFSHHYLAQKGFNQEQHLVVINNVAKLFDILKQRNSTLDFIVLNEKQYNKHRELDQTIPEMKKIYQISSTQTGLYFACNKRMNKTLKDKIKQSFVNLN